MDPWGHDEAIVNSAFQQKPSQDLPIFKGGIPTIRKY